jgi:type IV secretory pathway component VirB8
MRVHIAWLCILPFIGVVMQFVLLIKGNEWAWKNRRWDSVEHFLSVQRKWAWATAVVFGLMFLISLVILTFLSNLIYSL